MRSAETKPKKAASRKKRADVGAGMAEERVVELEQRWAKLVTWGAKEKLKANKATIAELEAFFKSWREGRKDETYVTSATADVRRLEKEAAAFDDAAKAQKPFVEPGPPKSAFDIEQAKPSLEVAADIGKVAQEGKAFLRDAAKDAFGELGNAASVVPMWAWIGGGLVVAYLVLDKISKTTVAIDALSSRHSKGNAFDSNDPLKGLLA